MSNKYLYLVAKVLLSLVLLLPILSYIGILFGADIEPKPEYYKTAEAYDFIKTIMDAGYITTINSIIFFVALILFWTKRTAVAAVIIFPITVNIVAFHAFIDGGLLTGGAVMGNLMLIINLYLFYYHWNQYSQLLGKEGAN